MPSIICPKCNNLILDEFDFCPHCGERVEKASKNDGEPIAKATIVWDKEMNKKFQNIHWSISGQIKIYIIVQIFFLLFIVPGILFAIVFWSLRAILIDNIYKNDLANNGGKPRTMHYEFYDRYLKYQDDRATATEDYKNFKVIAIKNGCITLLNQSMNIGYCIPLDKLNNSNELISIVSKYGSYKDYNK